MLDLINKSQLKDTSIDLERVLKDFLSLINDV